MATHVEVANINIPQSSECPLQEPDLMGAIVLNVVDNVIALQSFDSAPRCVASRKWQAPWKGGTSKKRESQKKT